MLIKHLTWMVSALLLASGALIIAPALAQTGAGACPALAERAMNELGQNCGGLGRNSACYGFNRVDATFSELVAEDFFSQPSDRSELVFLSSIETAPLDVDTDRWGIALLNVQANVPNTLPGQAVTFILLGDVKVDNAVPLQDVAQPADPISVTAMVAANLRSGPSPFANVIGSVPDNTELLADGLSTDGQWARVIFENGPAWINRELITSTADISALPTLSAERRSPMQAFYFRTGIGNAACVEAPPSLLVVQGPKNVSVDITANGADIRLSSTIVLMLIPGNRMQLIVIDGSARLGDLVIPAGFKITAPLSEDGQNLAGDWTDFSPLTEEDLTMLQGLENIPDSLLHYPIELPTIAAIQALLRALSGGTQSSVTIVDGVDCTGFKPTSPLGGLPFGETIFYWDAAPGATDYQINVFNERGEQVATYQTSAANTNLTGDTSSFGGGFSFSWQVVALRDGQIACASSPVTMFREVPSPKDEPVSTPELLPICGNFVCEFGLGEDAFNCPSDCASS